MQNAIKQEPTLGSFGLDIQVFTDVIACGTPDRRILLARQIAGFLGDPATPAGERAQVAPVALRLASDEDKSVRIAFAEALAPLTDLDADLLFTIVADEDDVALPFLAATAALDVPRSLAVLRAGGSACQAMVASRPGLAPEVIDCITREMPLAVNALLLENAEAEIFAVHYHTIYNRFGEDGDMLSLLLARPDLPPVIRLMQARRAAANITGMLARRGWLSPGTAAELVTDAEETATLQVLTEASPAQLPGAVAFLIDHEFMTPSLIVRAACLGAMDVVIQCLATLSGVPRRRTEDRIYGKGKFKALFARCGLPDSCFWTLKAACDVAREERSDGERLTADEFGRRLIENLLTRYDALPLAEQPRQLAFISRFAAEKARDLASRLKTDMQRAA